MKARPTVGQTLYSLNIGNAVRRGIQQELTPVEVTKVGRKYFYCGEGRRNTRYHLGSWKQDTNYSPTSKLYMHRQEWLDEKEEREVSASIGEFFKYGRNTQKVKLAALRTILKMLEANKE